MELSFKLRWLFLLGLLLVSCGPGSVSGATPPTPQNLNNGGMILRVRMVDGSIERIQIPSGKEDTLSLKDALSDLLSSSEDTKDSSPPKIQIGSKDIQDDSQTIAALGLQKGSLISLISTQPKPKPKPKDNNSSASSTNTKRWNPFPDIAKDYHAAVRKTKIHRSTKTGMSYGDIAKLHAALHSVEPQDVGPITRIYMCAKSAERFNKNCQTTATTAATSKKKKKTPATSSSSECRVGLLLGTIQRERVDLKPKARTSLSSQTEASQYCLAARVHALWEPATQKPTAKLYDTTAMPTTSFASETTTTSSNTDLPRVLRVAKLLGLKPIGWIFAYNDNRHEDTDALPVYAQDAKMGALLQIANMQHLGREDGCKFVTLSMQASTGATEAFQLSDVCVQMIAEDLWKDDCSEDDENDSSSGSKKKKKKKSNKPSRFVQTKHPVIVDGGETTELDSVLCLVNTAMLSQNGIFAGPPVNTVKKSGGVTNKVKKAILAAIDDNDNNKLLETLCDLNLLVSLDKSMAPADMEQVCTLVRKWARGQKRGTQIEDRLKNLLRSLLNQ